MPHASRKWTKEEENVLVSKKDEMTNEEIGLILNRSVSSIEKKMSKLGLRRVINPQSFQERVEEHSRKLTTKDLSNQLKDAIQENIILQKSQDIILGIKDNFGINKIEYIKPNAKDNEATMVVQWSDWHIDEVITFSQTNGLNSFNAEIAKKRAEQLFRATVRFIEIFRKDIIVNNLVIQLGGDFISGNINDELKENNSCGVMSAAINATNLIASGLEYINNNVKDLQITCVCNAGNHSRITHKQMVSTEFDNSVETFMYFILQDKFPNIKFFIDDSYFKYLDIYGYVCRFHHGHSINYGGGIGGVFIPIYKKISQWNKGKSANYDFIDHFHQSKDGGNFLLNGSLIGYNAYAIKIGADFEKPKQNVCLIDKKRGKTIVAPIILD
ncbi:MAG TPA: hypothetical protein PKL88_02445 [bacterium]|mgnify:CR=1 FL=1|nr:hypothetical protein [bacterium]